MNSSWLLQGSKSPRTSITSGCILLAVGLWDLYFVLFRSVDLLFTVVAVLLLLIGGLNILRGVIQLRTGGRGGAGSLRSG
jgi:hypothetical protein